MTKSDLLGWTLAELALALLFAITAGLLPTIQQHAKSAAVFENERLHEQALVNENQRLRVEQAALQAQITSSRANLRSRLTPPCSELDSHFGWLFTATARNQDSFEIDGKVLSLAQIRSEYSDALVEAKQRGCIQKVRINFQSGMSAETYDQALKRLNSLFYTQTLGER